MIEMDANIDIDTHNDTQNEPDSIAPSLSSGSGTANATATLTLDIIKENTDNFYNFLKKHKVVGDGVVYTHTSFGPPYGKYFIDDRMDYEKFLIAYKRVLETGLYGNCGGLYITEKQKKVGPIFIDYDFRLEEKTRQYSKKNIKKITKVYMNLILKYLDISNFDLDDVKAFVTEKENPTFDEKQNNYKDGPHIIIPLPIDVHIRFLIHEEAKEIIKNSNILSDIPYINDLDDVIDESVVVRNGWLMYGSKKWQRTPYVLTGVYDYNMKELNKSTYSRDELAVILAARRHDEDEPYELKEEFRTPQMKQHIKTIYDKYNGSKKQKNNIIRQEKIINNYVRPVANNNPDAAIAKKLVKILSAKRADKYPDWASVGWALYNIDSGLYPEFVEFSKKCAGKFNERGCKTFWDSAKPGGYTIASLYYWAKEDNPEEFQAILLESNSRVIENAQTGNHDDLAKVLYELYKYEYKCVSKTRNKWYAFYNNRWNCVDQAYTLSNIISDILAVMFAKLAISFYNKASFIQGGDRDGSGQKGHDLMKITEKLKTESFKNSVIASAANRFYDNKFEEKLDSNPNLLGFDNGVYDLENGIFRKGVPEDFLCMSTGYDYCSNYNLQSKEIIEIDNYFKQVMTEDDMREYTLCSFASFLDGHMRQQTFRIYTGSGGNAKSQTLDLIKDTMGKYFGVLPTGILTRKRGASSSATPELADKNGKRLLVIQEPEHDDVVYVGQMKNLTGADTIAARALYGDPFEYKPQFKIILICNKMPNIPANDGGTWRRIEVSPFESEFVDKVDPRKPRQFKKDPSLPEKMKKWKAAFMWMLLNIYYKKYKENNYIIEKPKKVTAFTDKYKRDSDKYQEFISEYIVETEDEDDSLSVVNLYQTFRNWHSEAGYGRNIPNRNEFVNHIRNTKNYELEAGNFIKICYKEDYAEREKNNKNKKLIKNNKNNKNKESDLDSDSDSDKDSSNESNASSKNKNKNKNKNIKNKDNNKKNISLNQNSENSDDDFTLD